MHMHVFYQLLAIPSQQYPTMQAPTAWLRSSAVAGRSPVSLILHHSDLLLHLCNPHIWSGCRAHHGQTLHECMHKWMCWHTCFQCIVVSMCGSVWVCVCECACKCVFVCQYRCAILSFSATAPLVLYLLSLCEYVSFSQSMLPPFSLWLPLFAPLLLLARLSTARSMRGRK